MGGIYRQPNERRLSRIPARPDHVYYTLPAAEDYPGENAARCCFWYQRYSFWLLQITSAGTFGFLHT